MYNFRVADRVAQIAFFVGYGFDFVHNVLLPGNALRACAGGLVAYGDLELTLLVSVAVVAVPSAIPGLFRMHSARASSSVREVVNLDSVERIYVIIASSCALETMLTIPTTMFQTTSHPGSCDGTNDALLGYQCLSIYAPLQP